MCSICSAPLEAQRVRKSVVRPYLDPMGMTNTRAETPPAGDITLHDAFDARTGAAEAIRSLAAALRSAGEIDVIVDIVGRPARLAPRADRALYRVVHESVATAWKHARCSVVRIALTFDRRHVHLSVVDDGTGLTETIPDRGRAGTSDMRRAVAEAGGTFRIRNAHPRGVLVEAEIPGDRR